MLNNYLNNQENGDQMTAVYFIKGPQRADKTSSVIDDLLSIKGITDGKIKVIKEDQSEEEIDFYSLTKEEQIELENLIQHMSVLYSGKHL